MDLGPTDCRAMREAESPAKGTGKKERLDSATPIFLFVVFLRRSPIPLTHIADCSSTPT